ncbi:hypothetical protein Bbelb_134900 [Branchiostoma belcheri]|nr:hypothetical protein Bbelb_134900 [Branchiostoma belcheri]
MITRSDFYVSDGQAPNGLISNPANDRCCFSRSPIFHADPFNGVLMWCLNEGGGQRCFGGGPSPQTTQPGLCYFTGTFLCGDTESAGASGSNGVSPLMEWERILRGTGRRVPYGALDEKRFRSTLEGRKLRPRGHRTATNCSSLDQL